MKLPNLNQFNWVLFIILILIIIFWSTVGYFIITTEWFHHLFKIT